MSKRKNRNTNTNSTRKMRKQANIDLIWEHFDRDALARICQMDEEEFAAEYDMTTVKVAQSSPSDFYAFRDNGSDILAVAHLDTVARSWNRQCGFLNTASGLVVYSRALDDRLGAYIILELLPKLGIDCDVLLTTGEESAQSTAAFFDAPKDYNWVIEFDRGGTDVVMYDYEDDYTIGLVEETGATVGVGIFSDICYLDHLGVKCFNWGVGYQEYHTARSHAYLDDTFLMLDYFMRFHALNSHEHMPHTPVPKRGSCYGYRWMNEDDDDDRDAELIAWWAEQLDKNADAEAQDAAEDAAWMRHWQQQEQPVEDVVLGEDGIQILG